MPKAIKKRVTKKLGLKEEEVKGAAIWSLDIIKGKKRIFIPALLLLGVAVISIVTFLLYYSSVKERAYSFEADAYSYYYNLNLKTPMAEEERWRKSLDLFQKAIKVRATPTAQFYAGNCYFNLGDYENAIKAYNQFIDKYKDEEVILPLVYQKLASAYVKNGKNDRAIKTLDTLARFKNGIFKDTALILEARLYEASEKHEDALIKYRELVKDFPFSLWTTEARARIELEDDRKEAVKPDESVSKEGLEN